DLWRKTMEAVGEKTISEVWKNLEPTPDWQNYYVEQSYSPPKQTFGPPSRAWASSHQHGNPNEDAAAAENDPAFHKLATRKRCAMRTSDGSLSFYFFDIDDNLPVPSDAKRRRRGNRMRLDCALKLRARDGLRGFEAPAMLMEASEARFQSI